MPVAGPLADVHAAPELDASFVYMMPRAPERGSVNKANGAAPEATEASAPEQTGAVAATVKPRAATGGGTIVATVPAPEPTEVSSAPKESSALVA